jgi:hypothetical protein
MEQATKSELQLQIELYKFAQEQVIYGSRWWDAFQTEIDEAYAEMSKQNIAWVDSDEPFDRDKVDGCFRHCCMCGCRLTGESGEWADYCSFCN